MASPLHQYFIDYERIVDNSSKLACYRKGGIIVSKIGEWVLQDHYHSSRKKVTYAYYHMLQNITGDESMGEKEGSIVYGFLSHLLLKLVLVVTLSHLLHFFLSRLKQPFIVSQIVACSLLFLRSNNGGVHGETNDNDLLLIPEKRRLETTIAFVTISFYLFVLALKCDITMLWRTEKKPIILGLSGMITPIVTAVILACILYNNISSFMKHREVALFCIAALTSHSPVLVLSEMLSEFGFLSSELGCLAIACARFQVRIAMAFLTLFGIVNQGQHGVLSILRMAFFSLVIVVLIVLIVRPYGLWIVQDVHTHGYVREIHICVIILTMILMALLSDMAGAVFYFGPMMMGFVLPNGPPIGTALVQRFELMGSEFFLPLCYFLLGYNMDWAAASRQSGLWMSIYGIVIVMCLSKFIAIVLAARYCDLPLKNGVLLGLIMNFKGNFEILTIIHLFYGKVLDRAALTMLISSFLVTMAICSPLVSMFYEPLNSENKILICDGVQGVHSHTELRVLSCFFDEKPIPTLLDFLECLTSPETQTYTCIYPLQLIDLNARVASSLISHRNEKGQINVKNMGTAHKHFISFGQEKTERVTVLPFTSVTPKENMSRDICAFILEKNIALILIPFPRKNSVASIDAQSNTWSLLPQVLEQARSSIGILVYHKISQITPDPHSYWIYQIGVVFFGGQDDREAIAIASRISGHPKVHIHILCFCTPDMIKKQRKKADELHDVEEALDREAIDRLRKDNISNNRLVVSEVTTEDIEQTLCTLHSLGDKYNLVIVGRRQGNSSSMISLTLEEWVESPELGVFGDLLASSKYKNPTNILVVQNHSS